MMCVVMPTITPWLFWGETMWNSYFISCILRYTVILNCTWLVNSAAHMWGKETKTFYLWLTQMRDNSDLILLQNMFALKI